MNFQRIKLSPSIQLNYAHSNRFKTDSITFYFILPLSMDTLASDSLVPEILRMGCENSPSPRSMTIRMQELYDSSVTVTQYHMAHRKIIAFSADFLASRFLPGQTDLLSDVTNFLYDIIFHPLINENKFSETYTTYCKKALIESVRSEINHKGSYALRRCRAAMCAGSVLSVLPYGSEDMIKNTTPESIMNSYQKLISSGHIECFYEGQESLSKIKEKLNVLSEHLQKNVLSAPESETMSYPPTQIHYIKENIKASQGRLVIGLRYPHCKTYEELSAFSVMLEILAYSPISKLFVRVREKLGLCYSCSALNDPAHDMLFLTAGIDNNMYEKTLNAMLAQVRQIGRNHFSESECSAAKKSLISSLSSLNDSPDHLEIFTLRRQLLGFPTSPKDEIARIKKTSNKEIAAIARKILPDTVFFLHADHCGDGGECYD